MKRLWAYSLVAGSFLLTAPLKLEAREPKVPNPCRELERDLDDQVNTLHRRQDAELAQCRRTYGKDDFVCRYVKVTQELELRQMRDERQDQLARCRGRAVRITPVLGPRQRESCDTYDRNRDRYARDKYPEPPYKEPPYKEPPKHPPTHHPPHHDGDGDGRHHRDSDAGSTRNAGASSNSGSSHSSGSADSSSGSGGSSSSSSYHSSSGSSSSSSSGGSYSSHSGSSGSSSGGSSGGSSSGGYSGGSSGGSSSSSSSSSSHESGGRPK